MNRNLQKIYRQVLYSLKKQYGDKITICQNTSVTTNYVTGAKSYTCSRTSISRAILLPTNFTRKTDYRLPMVSANKLFAFGATFDVGTKLIVIDVSDVPTYFELTQDDWILIDNTRYEIVAIEELEYHAGWIVGAKQVAGMTADLEVSLDTSDSLSITDEGAANKEAAETVTDTLGLTSNGSGAI